MTDYPTWWVCPVAVLALLIAVMAYYGVR